MDKNAYVVLENRSYGKVCLEKRILKKFVIIS